MESAEHRKPEANIFTSSRILKELSQALETFYRNPESFDRAEVDKLVRQFIREMKATFQDSEWIDQILSEFTSSEKRDKLAEWLRQLPNPIDVWKKARKVIQSEEVDEYGCDPSFEMTIKPLFDFLYHKYFRVQTLGIENVPPEGRSLLVSNHSGVLPYDAAMIKIGIYNEHPARRELRFLVDDFVFHFPFLGIFMNRIGGVRACPENAERLLNHDEIVSVFPEGIKGISKPYSERYQLQRFGRGGVIRLALKTKAPIIPVAVIGAEEIHPLIYKSSILARPLGLPFIPFTPFFPLLGPLGAIPLPTKWTILFGKPIPFDQYTTRDINDGILINRETERLRSVIQEMIDRQLSERRSVFFG